MKGKSNNPTIQMLYLMIIDSEENKRKFVVLYEKYRYLLMKVAYDVLGDNYLAEDAVHEAFIKVTKNMEKIGDVNSQETKRYLITITKNSAIDIYRKKCIQMKREVFVDELDEEEMPFACMETDTDNSVLDILKNLPANYKDVFLLKYSSRLKNSEIAELLGISEANVRKRLSRGKEMIQKSLNNPEDRANGTHRSD